MLVCLVAAGLVSSQIPSVTVYYTEALNLSCECRGIPKPDVQWLYNTTLGVFNVNDIHDIANSGKCNNTVHSGSELTWAEGGEEARKGASGEVVTCHCDNDVGSPVQTRTVINVQCECRFHIKNSSTTVSNYRLF